MVGEVGRNARRARFGASTSLACPITHTNTHLARYAELLSQMFTETQSAVNNHYVQL